MKHLLALSLGVTLFGSFACDDKKADEKKADGKKSDDKKSDDKKADAKKTDAKVDAKSADAKDEKKADAPEAKPGDAPPATAATLTLGKAKIFETKNPDKPIEIAEDGSVTMEGEVGAKVTAAGKVTSPDGAKVLMEVDATGKVTSGGKDIGVVVSDTGATFDLDGKKSTMTFVADGSMLLDPKPEKNDEMRHEGCVGPMAKTCALVMVGVLFVEEPAAAPPPTAGGPAVEPTPPATPPK